MITDLPLRWALSVLLAATAAVSVFALTRRGVGVHQRVGHLLHAVMAVAMIVMAFPRGMDLPTTAPMIFFIIAGLWFVGVGLVTRTGLLINGYHSAMMAAMAWMYAVMDGSLLPGTMGHGDHGGSSMSMSSNSGGAHSHHSSMGGHGGDMAATGWVGGVNTVLVVAFGVAAAWWLYRYVAARQSDTPPTSITDHAAFLGQTVMAGAMAVMFAYM